MLSAVLNAVLLIFIVSDVVFAQDNVCYKKAVPFQSISHAKESILILESRRVVSIKGNTLTYNLGKESITIKADDFISQRFLKEVKSGKCSAREKVKLIPERKSPFNFQFKAYRAH